MKMRMKKYDDDDGIVLNGWMLYPDGSYREIIPHLTGGGLLIGQNDYEVAELKLKYAQARLMLTEYDYNELVSIAVVATT